LVARAAPRRSRTSSAISRCGIISLAAFRKTETTELASDDQFPTG
jgi:hypothetical protein